MRTNALLETRAAQHRSTTRASAGGSEGCSGATSPGSARHRQGGARSIRSIIAKRAAAAGVAGRVSGHSLRVGSAQSRSQQPALGLVELQEAGDWQAPTMPAHYARHQFAARGAVAKLRYQAGR